jgi:GntR family transcriptional regulator / MocR family aminotransferase
LKRRRHIDVPLRSPRPGSTALWRALADSIAWQIDIGRLAIGSRLPATRTLARQLGISRTTAAAAYDELASRGYLRARVGDGAYVTTLDQRDTPMLTDRPRVIGSTPDATTLVLIGCGPAVAIER